MSWWNDLSTHRTAPSRGFDWAVRQGSTFASPRERRAASPEHHSCAAHNTIVGSFNPSNGVASNEITWGTSTPQSDVPSLWQTSNSAGISDQLGLSGNSPIWTPQQTQHQRQHSSTSPSPRCADAFAASSPLSGKGMFSSVVPALPANGSCSTSNESAAVASAVVNGFTAATVAVAGPHQPQKPQQQQQHECTGGSGDCHRSLHTPENHLSGTAAGAGIGAAVSAEDNRSTADSDDISLHDDVDLGTISSLIASLQGHSAQPDSEEEAANRLRSNQGEPGRFETPTSAHALPQTAPTAVVDPSSTSAGQASSLHSRGLFADPARNLQEEDLNRSSDGNAATAEEGGAAPRGSPYASTVPQPNGGTANIAPLHLTPSMLEGLLANFQTALVGRADAASSKSPPPQVEDMETLHGDFHSSPDTQDGFVTGDGSPTTGGAPQACCGGSPLMRGHVSSVVAYKLNTDGNVRGTPVQDFRRGVVATASVGSSGCFSDPPTPVRHRGTSVPGRRNLSHHNNPHLSTHERAASPDSSIDHFLSQETPSVTGFAAVRNLASGSTEDNAARTAVTTSSNRHIRTESEISLPAAASTYDGSGTLHQHVDERGCITVVDPQRRKLHVPLSAIQTTKALNGRLKTPSLCLLFQSGRCRQGDNCYQVHVDPPTVARLRADVASLPCCCMLHGDCNCHLADSALYEGRSLCIAGQYNVPLSRVAYTAGLQRILQEESTSVTVNPSVLCRLHGQPGGCRFGADCKFIHVCCRILKNELAHVMSNAATAAAAAASASAQAAQAVQAQQQPHPHPHPQRQQQTLPPQRLGSSAPGSPSTFLLSHSFSGVVNTSLPHNSMAPAMVVPRQMLALPPGATTVTGAGEPSMSHPLPMKAARPLPSNSSPVLQELRQSNRSPLMGTPGGVASNGGALYNRNFATTPRQTGNNDSSVNNNNSATTSSLFSSANFSPMQLSQAAPFLTTSYSSAGAIANTTTALQPSGPLFTVTAVPQSRTSPAQSPTGRPAPPPLPLLQQQHQPQQQQQSMSAASMPGSPKSVYHLHTLSSQSSGARQHPYPSSAVVQTPNCSGPGSPLVTGLPTARSLPNMCSVAGLFMPSGGRSSGFSPVQRQLLQQTTPPQAQQPPQPRQQHSTSQQLYVQQVNQDGTVSFVPVNMMQNFGG
jgi:hypothetical protein